ncbi:MAG: XRE family transcriptional regulator [Coriobacteriales bacterium]|jgi:ribosome-binding protein aMBF1 (putative translation factor)|nr:XRE family transcriptional regulator [Coriobacteriales bacterium]
MIFLTKERTKLGLSQAALARKAELNASTVCCIERGKMKPWPGQAAKIESAMKDAGWNGKGDLFEAVEE